MVTLGTGIIGGGVSNKSDKFISCLTLPTPIVAAELRPDAGIIGAAHAYERQRLHARQKRFIG